MWDDEDEDTTTDGNAMRELRKHTRQLEKELKELRSERDALAARTRTSTVADILKARSLPEKVAGLIPSDVEATPEAVNKWLDDFSDVFGQKAEPPVEGDAPAPSASPNLSADDIAALRQMDRVAGTAVASGDEQALAARIASVQTLDELDQLVLGRARNN